MINSMAACEEPLLGKDEVHSSGADAVDGKDQNRDYGEQTLDQARVFSEKRQSRHGVFERLE